MKHVVALFGLARFTTRYLGLPLLLVAGGCTGHKPAPTAEVLLEADRAFARMAAEKGAPEAFHFYAAENAISLPNGAAPVQGRNQIRELMASGPEGELSWMPQGGGIARSGELGWTWGTYEYRQKAPGAKTSYGKYVTVWQKQADRRWRFVLDGGNTSPVPAP